MLIGTDLPVAGWRRLPGLHRAAADAGARGLSPYEALVTATLVPRHILELSTAPAPSRGDHELTGADLGNPLENIKFANDPAGVMIGGRWLPPRTELERRLDDYYRRDDGGTAFMRPNTSTDLRVCELLRGFLHLRVRRAATAERGRLAQQAAAVGLLDFIRPSAIARYVRVLADDFDAVAPPSRARSCGRLCRGSMAGARHDAGGGQQQYLVSTLCDRRIEPGQCRSVVVFSAEGREASADFISAARLAASLVPEMTVAVRFA